MERTEPPWLATWMLEHLSSGFRDEAVGGDLLEEFRAGRSDRWYWAAAHKAHGTPISVDIESSDSIPLMMDARQECLQRFAHRVAVRYTLKSKIAITAQVRYSFSRPRRWNIATNTNTVSGAATDCIDAVRTLCS